MSIKKRFQGTVVPAITPLNEDFTLDTVAVERLLLFFRKHGVSPFILGTTGEAPSLPASVKEAYIRVAGQLKLPGEQLYAGISSNCLQDSIEWSHRAFDAGVDVVVATLPSYYALSHSQMKKYFEKLADAVPGPLIIYNIPATTHHSIPLSTIDELSHHPRIVGTKDSERSEERLHASLQLWAGREDFSHFLGWAAKSGEALLHGGDGLVPSTANFAPCLYSDMAAAAAAGEKEKVTGLQEVSDKLGNSYQAGRSLGESLAVLKLIMEKEGLCKHYMMPPL